MPALLRGLIAPTATAASHEDVYSTPGASFYPHGSNQPGFHLASVIITLGLSLVYGAFVVGLLVLAVRKHLNSIPDKLLFEDGAAFETPEDEEDLQNTDKDKHAQTLMVKDGRKDVVV
ncbi:hypothetical protein HDV00_005367 [Rhizophlyctis rosea]|nr:hypothetical protein HDV00_005367 [Rhizophlyctis rosea]